ncbi:MAG: hypothetical protein ACRCUB_09665 [Plesiomonas shigelloides]
MTAYIIKEVSNVNSDRKESLTVNGSLASAKRCASRSQAFQGTVMKIENIRGVLVAYKKDGQWFDTNNEWADA